MAIFRLAENTPAAYVNQSRDFQLLCALFDLVQNSTKHRIDSMLLMLDTEKCPDSLLPLLQTKVGFFVTDSALYTADKLRVILSVFQYIVRFKGSRVGIQFAVNTFIKLLNVSGVSSVKVNTADHVVDVESTVDLSDTRILNDIFLYILPAGFKVHYLQYYPTKAADVMNIEDSVTLRNYASHNVVSKDDPDNSKFTRNELFNIGGVSTTVTAIYTDTKENET